MLVVRHGPNAGSSYRLETTVTAIGRHPDSEIFLDDITVSRRHVVVERDDDGYTLRDVGSLNGTYVNRKRVDEARLRDRDEVQIGRYRLDVRPRRRAGRLTMAKRAHSSIGDVLNQLREEFPDITISKIRFLESQGLVEPERTPSGYRKFYPTDVERLRFILRQQREHFLPLKVIKERLDEVDRSGGFTVDGIGRRNERRAYGRPGDRRRAVRGDAACRAERRGALGRGAGARRGGTRKTSGPPRPA